MRQHSIEEIRKIINIDDSRDNLLTDLGKKILKDRYCLVGESYQDVFARASVAFCGEDFKLAQRLYDYSSKLWFMFATPLISNGGTDKGLPISCFLNYVEDSIEGLSNNLVENCYLATGGGGIGSYWGDIRSIGQITSKGIETPGALPFMHVVDSQMLAYHQGSTRRGAAAVYMDIDHPEIEEFISMRSSTGGDMHRKNENLHHGINICDDFMNCLKEGKDWSLVDPNTKEAVKTVSARTLWIKLLETRVKLGEPYIFFKDTANRDLPKSQKEKGLKIHHSNLCTEITLPTNTNRTAVCCLSSVNLAKFDEWENHPQFIEDLILMLDNTLQVFIEDAPDQLYKAVNSAVNERSIGLGAMGFHTLLQKKNIEISSEEANDLNDTIFKTIKDRAVKASKILAEELGEPEDMTFTGLRNAHLLAIAPNASSSLICGEVSPGIEPLSANAFSQKTKSGTDLVKNHVLEEVLEKYDKNTNEVWSSIVINSGSVQHLSFLSAKEKDLFLTALEIDQSYLIRLAADRQKYICQSQSLNLFLPPNVTTKELHNLHFSAWQLGLKSLYYLRSQSSKAVKLTTELDPNDNKVVCTDDICTMCEG